MFSIKRQQAKHGRDSVADAFRHRKVIGYDKSAIPLLAKAGIEDDVNQGTIILPGKGGLASFVEELGMLRVRGREPSLKLGKALPPVK